MTPRPIIFVSAASKELKSARQLVCNTLQFLGYEPVWQDIFGTEQGNLRAMLREKIDGCAGVVQLVGRTYGAEPPQPDERFGRVSYTQYEALYARMRGKKVWYLFLDDHFPEDPHEAETEELQELQAAYRRRLKSQSTLYHTLDSREALETSVLKLRDDLTRLRRGVRQWATAVIILLVAIVALAAWEEYGRQQENGELKAMKDEMAQLREGLVQYPGVQTKVQQSQPGQSADEVQQQTYAELGKQLGVNPKVLQEKLPQFAKELQTFPDATTFDRANAAYLVANYSEAERLALSAANDAQNATTPNPTDVIKALQLAGEAAEARIEYAEALDHYRAAEKLTDRARDPLEWASVQWNLGYVLDEQGQYAEAETAYSGALEEQLRAQGEQAPDVLSLRNNVASVLDAEGKYPDAEAEDQQVVQVEEQVLGMENPVTLSTRNNLGIVLQEEGKLTAAEAEDRNVIKLRSSVLGPENPATLSTRDNLAIVLYEEEKYADAATEIQDVIQLDEKVLGPENPSTLDARAVQAGILEKEGKYADAEAEDRDIIKTQEEVLGPENPSTLDTRHNLANLYYQEGKYSDAESEYRDVVGLMEKVLGPEHPTTLATRAAFAAVLAHNGKEAEAKAELQGAATQRGGL